MLTCSTFEVGLEGRCRKPLRLLPRCSRRRKAGNRLLKFIYLEEQHLVTDLQ